jgi:transcription elongation factor GreA
MEGDMNRINIKKFPSNKNFLLTKEGLDNLKAELDSLRKERYAICEELRSLDADEKQDHILSTDAIKMLQLNESEVNTISDVLLRSKVITKDENPSDVKLGSTVKLRFGDHTVEYTLVDTIEADPSVNKISEKSPLGLALLGRHAHEHIRFMAPKGKVYRYKLEYIA